MIYDQSKPDPMRCQWTWLVSGLPTRCTARPLYMAEFVEPERLGDDKRPRFEPAPPPAFSLCMECAMAASRHFHNRIILRKMHK